jgi:UDP-N-acetylglucosamine 2-epimerase (non-hydrolysing)
MNKILLVFGTRPEAIKMAPLVKEFQKYPDIFYTKVCVTGQHRQMLDQVLDVFNIKPDYDLNIMAPNQDLYDITSKVLLGMRNILAEWKPDIVFVHGDTTTSVVTGIAAFYKQIKVAHVEAGLRTYNLLAPWPEELNRQLTDRLCEFLFAPTEASRNNLLQEKIEDKKIFVTGNTVIDALLMAIDIIKNNSELQQNIKDEIKQNGYSLETTRKIILVTGHRRENFGGGFLNICNALKKIAFDSQDIDIVYPVHLNPNVRKPVYDLLSGINNIYLISPLNYLPFLYLMQNSFIILTDSGGVQEEAPSLGKPVLVMRNTTERPEAVEAGTVKLIGTDTAEIIKNIKLLINDKDVYSRMAFAHNPYGDGKACEKIVRIIQENKISSSE